MRQRTMVKWRQMTSPSGAKHRFTKLVLERGDVCVICIPPGAYAPLMVTDDRGLALLPPNGKMWTDEEKAAIFDEQVSGAAFALGALQPVAPIAPGTASGALAGQCPGSPPSIDPHAPEAA